VSQTSLIWELNVKFNQTNLAGAYTIELDRIGDDRGFFARFFCVDEFSKQGLVSNFVQINNSLTKNKGTLRGMHYQVAPSEETKSVRCTMGAIYDVIIDLRPNSPTFKAWLSVELSAENRKMIYIPVGFSHGFMTLADNTEVFYQMSEFYAPECARGVRWNDPAFDIVWPAEVTAISEKDRQYPDFQ
jgi:dTDP-4-dehydrorhamnose 3,5-epimerase